MPVCRKPNGSGGAACRPNKFYSIACLYFAWNKKTGQLVSSVALPWWLDMAIERHVCRPKIVYEGYCTVVVEEKRNKPPLEVKGDFVVRQCACGEYSAKPLVTQCRAAA